MTRRWLSVRVHLIAGRGESYDPPPGRLLAMPLDTTFEEFGAAVDQALGRWDLGQDRRFLLADGTERLGEPARPVRTTLAGR